MQKGGEAMAELQGQSRPHNVILESRKRMNLSGITDVDSFDEQLVVLYCDTGQIAIRGEQLHINRIDVETGEVSLEGSRIDGISYTDQRPNRGGLISRLFR